MRIDLLLSRLCLMKTRSQAGRACDRGGVRLNGRVAKAAAEVRAGDRIIFPEPSGRFIREIEILGLPEGGVSRAAARDLYRRIDRRELDDPWGSPGQPADAP